MANRYTITIDLTPLVEGINAFVSWVNKATCYFADLYSTLPVRLIMARHNLRALQLQRTALPAPEKVYLLTAPREDDVTHG